MHASVAAAGLLFSEQSDIMSQMMWASSVRNSNCQHGMPESYSIHQSSPAANHYSHMHVQAQRLLLRSALQDPLNQRFVFLSEACAPLIPAATMYAQLMSEPRSRINACNKPDWDRNLDR